MFTISLAFSVFRTVLETMETALAGQKQVGPFEDKYKVGAGLNDDVETKLCLFYPCKLINNLLKIADMIDDRLRNFNIQGQERGSGGGPKQLLGRGLSSWMRSLDRGLPVHPLSELPPSLRTHHG